MRYEALLAGTPTYQPASHLAENTWTKQTACQRARLSGWLMSECDGVQFKLITSKIDAYAGQNVQTDWTGTARWTHGQAVVGRLIGRHWETHSAYGNKRRRRTVSLAGWLSEWWIGRVNRPSRHAHTNHAAKQYSIATSEHRAHPLPGYCVSPTPRPSPLAPSPPPTLCLSRYIQSINQSIMHWSSCIAINECLAGHARQQSTRRVFAASKQCTDRIRPSTDRVV